MIVLESGPKFSEYKFNSFAMKCRLLCFLVANILKAMDQKNQVAVGKCCEAYYEVSQVITVKL